MENSAVEDLKVDVNSATSMLELKASHVGSSRRVTGLYTASCLSFGASLLGFWQMTQDEALILPIGAAVSSSLFLSGIFKKPPIIFSEN